VGKRTNAAMSAKTAFILSPKKVGEKREIRVLGDSNQRSW
jgi:hypothetical protein